jgi:hypothetical protein
MLFTNKRSQPSYIQNKIQTSKNTNQNVNVFSMIMPYRAKNVNIPITSNQKIEESVNPPPPKKMKWGEPTWFLLHCLAEKVKDENFNSIRVDLLNIMYSICANLPCPDCAKHASDYLKSIQFNEIQTKSRLKTILFNFHNMINIKKNMPIFPREQLENKYQNMELIPIIYTFMGHFQDKHKSIRMIANDFYRSRISEQIKEWFRLNISNFNP